MTSHDAVAFVRRVLKEKRVGHTGTLDPAAAGVLPICVGAATRLVEELQAGTKRYIAEATFGQETDSGDLLGATVREADAAGLSVDDVRAVLNDFRGVITQTPPLHSAIKVGGVKLYELARAGKEIDIPTRQVTISRLELARWNASVPSALLDIECSGGTYIRSLIRDIGRDIDCAATMSFLVRERSGLFSVADAISPEEFERAPQLIPVRTILEQLTAEIITDDALALALWQGKRVQLTPTFPDDTRPIAVENEAQTLFALASRVEGGGWKADKVFDLR